MNIRNRFVRTSSVVAGASALAMVAAGPASAHHCLKEWNDAARAQVSSGTAWMPMSDFVHMVVTQWMGLSPECGAHADEWTAAWLDHTDRASEPTIHMKATAAGGTAHQGKEVKSFTYLSDDDIAFVEGQIFSEDACVG